MDDQLLQPMSTAVDTPVAAENIEGAQTFSDAPPVTATPDTSAWDMERQRLEADLAREREARLAYERQMAQEALRAWEESERQVVTKARDGDMTADQVAEFYRQRERALQTYTQQQQQSIQAERIAAFADKVIADNGLDSGDRVRLLYVGQSDPNAMVTEAQRIKSERSRQSAEITQLRQEIENLKRGQQANTIRQSGAWDTGGARGQAPVGEIKPGSQEQLRSILFGR